MAQVHGEIAKEASEAGRTEQPVGPDPSDHFGHGRGPEPLDGQARHVGAIDHASLCRLGGVDTKALLRDGGRAFDPKGGFLRGERDLAHTLQLEWVFGAALGS